MKLMESIEIQGRKMKRDKTWKYYPENIIRNRFPA
jgi:hypothetical protein